MALGLKPVKLLPARERVAAALRKAILSRQLKDGDTLTLEQTSSELGVSVTPVREAFQILARDGLIELKANKGAVVLGISRKTLQDHYTIRALLESEACRLCCENGADLARVRETFEASRQALGNDSEDYGDFNQSFHYEIWIAAGNEKLKSMLSELWNGASMGIKTTVSEYSQISFDEHSLILTALENRDAKAAVSAMKAHIIRSLNNILTHYE